MNTGHSSAVPELVTVQVDYLKKIDEHIAFLQRKIKRLEFDNQELSDEISSNIKRYRKPYAEQSAKNKNYIKADIRKEVVDINTRLAKLRLKITDVKVVLYDENDVGYEKRSESEKMKDVKVYMSDPTVDPLSVAQVLLVKDRHCLSNKTYMDLKKSFRLDYVLPSLHSVMAHQKYLNSLIKITEISSGFFVCLKTTIAKRLQIFLDKSGDRKTVDCLKVKLSIDGTNIGKNLKLINFTFTIINEVNKARTASGNYTLGIIEITSENYETIKEWLVPCIEQIKDFNELTYKDKTHKIDYFFGGDMKIMCIVLGLYSSASSYPCVWCKAEKSELHLVKSDMSILNRDRTTQHSAGRYFEEQCKIVNGNSKVHFGYKHESLLGNFIPFEKCVPDTLHLLLRVCDYLMQHLCVDLCEMDKFTGEKSLKLSRHANIAKYFEFCKAECNMNLTPFFGDSKGRSKLHRDLSGFEYIKLMKSLDLVRLFPQMKAVEAKQRLWSDFHAIYNSLINYTLTTESLKKATQSWFDLYLSVYATKQVTPYMHALVAHLHEFSELYGDISMFNLQGLEKLNDITTKQYFRSTNMRDKPLKQMLLKRARMQMCEVVEKEEEED